MRPEAFLHPDKPLGHNVLVVAPVKSGDILADKYCVERILGIGGMGVVVKAEHVALHTKVALKFMLPDALADESAVARFMREARLAVKLRSEHVARVLDVGCLENGAPYIVMEFLEGEDMEDVIRREAPMVPVTAVDFILQACMAMAEAHSIGIVHRDLKPANLFVTKRPDGSRQVKVLDFGISKVAGGETEVSQTKSSTAMGSPGYMAPEQMRDAKNADHRADIWALGTILYKLLSNKLPFFAESAPEMFAAVLTGQSIPLPSVMPGVESALAEVIHRCLERDRELRYSSIAELAKALAPFGNDKAAHMAASIANVGVGAEIATLPSNPDARSTTPMRKAHPPLDEAADATPTSDMPATRLSNGQPVQPAPNFGENPLTTRRASAGQAVVAAPHTEESEQAGRGRLGMVAAGVGIAAVALLVGVKAISGGSEEAPAQPATVSATEVSDAAVVAPLAISFDAGPIDGGTAEDLAVMSADAAPVAADDSKQAPKQPKRPKRPKTDPKPKPKPKVDPKPDPKPEPKPKPKPNDDPFGTMQ